MLLEEIQTINEKLNLSDTEIHFADDEIRDNAIEILAGAGMKGIMPQKNKASLTLKFTDRETAKQAHDLLKGKL